MIRVEFVCLGNICRSPMAHAVFQQLVNQAGLSDRIIVDSAGTGRWHVGEPVHRGTREVLSRNGIEFDHRARQISRSDVSEADYVVAMDADNFADLQHLVRRELPDGKLFMLLDFAPEGSPREVPDPYYEDNFDHVYELVEAGCRGFLAHIRAEHDL
jgi:protein-tyrosine phosphatase